MLVSKIREFEYQELVQAIAFEALFTMSGCYNERRAMLAAMWKRAKQLTPQNPQLPHVLS